MNETGSNDNTNLNNADQPDGGQPCPGQYQDYGQYQNYGQNPPYNYGQQQYQNYDQNAPYNYGQQQYQNYGQNGPYNYGQQPFANPQAAYQQAVPVQESVSNVFYYILMALTAVSTISTIIFSMNLISATFSSSSVDAVLNQDFASLYSSMMATYSASAGASVLYSLLTYGLGFGILVFSIIDIITVHKKGYPILGLILFTIFLKPGYFIWRAYVVKQKKTLPVVFTVCYVMAYALYFFWCLTLVMRMMSGV